MKSFRNVSFAIAAFVFSVTSLRAAPIVYSLDHVIGIGSVTGTITTNGDLGELEAEDLIDWTLHLNDGVESFTLFGPASGNNSALYLGGSALSATASALLFDFSASGSDVAVVFQNPYLTSNHNWFAIYGSEYGSSMNVAVVDVGAGGAEQVSSQLGVQAIAQASVPDGGNLLVLFGVAMIAMVGVRRFAAR